MSFRGRASRRGRAAPYEQEVSDAQKALFLKTLDGQFEPSVKDAAVKAGITRKQLEKALSTDREFAARFAAWKHGVLDGVEDRALQQAMAGDGAMIRFILQAERPEKYSAKAAKPGIADKIESLEDLKKLTDEELEQLRAECGG